MDPKVTIGDVKVYQEGDHIWWTSGLAIDVDGAPNTYHPDGSPPGLDRLGNAGHAGDWWGIVTDTGEKDGTPVVQGAGSPYPGFYISQTALVDHGYDRCDSRRYVDATKIPYLSVPPELLHLGVKMGDVGMVYYGQQSSAAVCADVGPRGHIGEGSAALARALYINADPKHGGCATGVEYHVWVGSTKGWPRAFNDIISQACSYTVEHAPAA